MFKTVKNLLRPLSEFKFGSNLRLSPFRKAENMKKPSKASKQANLLDVFRYADTLDYFLLAVALLGIVSLGNVPPVNNLIFTHVTNTLVHGEIAYRNGTFNFEQYSAEMIQFVFLYFIVGASSFAITLISMGCLSTVCERQIHKIRKNLFRAILNQNAAWFDQNEVGSITQKMTREIDRIKFGLSDKLGLIIQAVSTLCFGVIYAFILNWQMALAMLVVAPFIFVSFFGAARTIAAPLRGEMDAYGAAGAVAEEVLNAVRVVASFNAQLFEIERYKKCLDVGRRKGIRKATIIATFMGTYLLLLYCSMGLTFWYGTTLVFDGVISPGTVFGVFWCVIVGTVHLGEALPQVQVIVAAKLAAAEIFSIIDRVPMPDSSARRGQRLKAIEGRIEFRNVQFAYPSRPSLKVLKKVSFVVGPGESVALVGHSGCGKSTVFSLLMRYYDFHQGSVMVDGINIQDLNVEWLRNTVGVVAQEPVIFAATVEQNLRMANEEATHEMIIEACKIGYAHEFICKFEQGYNTLIGEGGVKLSGGQKQRLAIARALVRNPKILLLDEATSALDTESEQIVQKALDQASKGRTTITIAHRLSTIRNADKIIVFDGGEIVEVGTHDELVVRENGVYRQLVTAQQITGGVPMHKSEETEFCGVELEKYRTNRKISLANGSNCKAPAAIQPHTTANECDIPPASVREIFRFARPERKLFVGGFLFAILMSATWPISSVLYGRFFLAMSEGKNAEQLSAARQLSIYNAMAFGVLGLMTGLATFGSGSMLARVGESMTSRLRLDVFKNLLRQEMSFFEEKGQSTGKLTTHLSTEAPNVQSAIDQRLSSAFQGVISLAIGIALAFYFGWRVAPFGLLPTLTFIFLHLRISAHIQKRGMRDSKIADNASKIATESIQHVKTIQALTRQKALFDAFCDAFQNPHTQAIVRGWWQAVGFALSTSFMSLNFAFVYFVGLILVRADFATPFVVFQVVEILNKAGIVIMKTSNYFPEFSRAKISAGLMFSMMCREPKIDALSSDGCATVVKGSIEAKDIHFAYPNSSHHLVLNGFSLSATVGKTVALVGSSGCGKSTVIQLLERFYDVLHGSMSVDERDVRQFNIRHLRGSIALVSQEPILFNLSVRKNIAYGMSDDEFSQNDIEAAARLANIHDFVESLPEKYDTLLGARGAQLSGGQKQRIAIARAIIRNPKIILLDEATSALDTESERLVQCALERAREGRTCVVIAHRLSTIQRADLIAVLRDGKVCEAGTHQQLLSRRGFYHKLVHSQNFAKTSQLNCSDLSE